jgi:hypothetical protein
MTQAILEDVPGHPGIVLKVYGPIKQPSQGAEVAQGFTVLVQGTPTARSELPDNVRTAVRALLVEKFPEHALI